MNDDEKPRVEPWVKVLIAAFLLVIGFLAWSVAGSVWNAVIP